MAGTQNVSDADFSDVVVKAREPFLVDFWAPWCGPCRAVAPLVDELAEEYAGRVGFAKVNVDDNPKVASEYGIRSIPTILLFKDGKPMKQMVGLKSKAELEEGLESVL